MELVKLVETSGKDDKAESPKIDELDLAIIDILRQDARTTITEISEKTKLSKMAVKRRIEKLVNSGVILGFHALVDSKMLGKRYSLALDIKVLPSCIERVAKELCELDHVVRVYELSSPELHVHALFDGLDELESFKRKIEEIEGVVEYDSHIVIKTYKADVSLTL